MSLAHATTIITRVMESRAPAAPREARVNFLVWQQHRPVVWSRAYIRRFPYQSLGTPKHTEKQSSAGQSENDRYPHSSSTKQTAKGYMLL